MKQQIESLFKYVLNFVFVNISLSFQDIVLIHVNLYQKNQKEKYVSSCSEQNECAKNLLYQLKQI